MGKWDAIVAIIFILAVATMATIGSLIKAGVFN